MRAGDSGRRDRALQRHGRSRARRHRGRTRRRVHRRVDPRHERSHVARCDAHWGGRSSTHWDGRSSAGDTRSSPGITASVRMGPPKLFMDRSNARSVPPLAFDGSATTEFALLYADTPDWALLATIAPRSFPKGRRTRVEIDASWPSPGRTNHTARSLDPSAETGNGAPNWTSRSSTQT